MRWLNVATMSNTTHNNVNTNAFWLTHSDPTQSAVHLALHWLAYVYPESDIQLDQTLSQALSCQDGALSEQWRHFLESGSVEEHVSALEWLSETLSPDQTPFLMETAWRLLLADHAMPNQVPLALRLLARILKLPERHVYSIGERIWQDEQGSGQFNSDERPVLLPDDPRYLDRIEWRLYGGSGQANQRPVATQSSSMSATWVWHHGLTFVAGLISGVSVLAFLVWGPMELGVQRLPSATGSIEVMPAPPRNDDSDTLELDAAIADLLGDIPNLAEEFGPREPAADQYSDLLAQALRDLDLPPDMESSIEDSPSHPIDSDSVIDTQEREVDQPEGADVTLAEPEQPEEVEPVEVEMRVTASVLNVRERATVNSVVVMQLSEGQRVWVNPDRREGDWENVRLDQLEGYASGQFLESIETE